MKFVFEEGQEPILHGDVHFQFKHRGMMYDNLICRVAFNTAFIPEINSLHFTKKTSSPDKLKKDPKIPDNFLVKLIFEDFCKSCNKP
jgi:C2 domain of PTEN tumour-suppressor protein